MSWQDKVGLHIGVAELKEDRGWSRAMIKQYLGEPDRTDPNPGGPNAPQVKLWLFTRVKAIEATDEFQERWWKARDRRQAQQRPKPQNAGDTTAGASC
ncbi:hypothetical protein ACFORH_43205 [Amycolatopsis roodepoortensis]|uniref:XRE family transcriptional regulator n=1 Tax=Amycolatopsis roodepoortensis TaxID=700274 RepID=A0ABR9LIF7_9PSEU|nr:hypothetical protein [Amycolatopsis roodepoortensis]MBE1580449.1 hypothetical protein [Amycolatopsis roodepoortensis]